MDSAERQHLLDLVGGVLDCRPSAVAEQLTRELAWTMPNTEETLCAIREHARDAGLPVLGVHYAEGGRVVMLEFPPPESFETVSVR